MLVKLNKELIQACDTVYQKNSRTTVETDVNVPDINPDIMKILDVSGYTSVSEKSLGGGKVCIKGTVIMNVLYMPDGEVISKVKCLKASKDFTYSVDIGKKDEGLRLFTEVEPESFAYTLINSRKISLRCVLGIDIKICESTEFEVAVSCDVEESICTENHPIRICTNDIYCENRLKISEKYEIPSDKPPIGEILKKSVFPQSTEFSMLDGKASAKGQVRICTLYISDDDGSVCSVEYTLPFDEIFDADGAEEDMEGEIEYCVSDIMCEVCDDSDGEPRIIRTEIGIGTFIRGYRIFEPSVIFDAYSVKGEADIKSEKRKIEMLTDNTTVQFTHKTEVSVPDGMSDISVLCDATVSAEVNNIVVGNGELTINGVLTGCISYIGDESCPLVVFADKSEFKHTVAAPGVTENSVCDAKIFVEHVSGTMSGSREVDLRTVLGICIRSFAEEEIPVIEEIEISEEDEDTSKPSIIVYFVKSGDTLWNIAKKYRTTVDDVKKYNDLTSDNISVGQQIRILR